MTTLTEHIIVAGAENRPPMLEKSMYDSWASRIRLFIKGKKHGRMMLDSIDNGPLVYPTVEENGQTRPMKYSELTEAQQLQDDCNVQATNIILHDLPPDGETLYEYYWRFSQLINDVHTIRMTMQQVQVNTKFLNAFRPEWSKFVTDVKLAKSLYSTNYDQLYAYLSQPERHANEVRIMRERYPDPLPLVANSPVLYNPSQSPQHSAEFPQLDSSLVVPMFQQGEDPIECINKAMTFLSAVASRFPPSNNQLRTSSNPRNQSTIQDGRVTVQQVQGRQTQSYAGTGNRGIATTSKENYAAGQLRVVKCYNCQGEGHIARQCQILDEEQLAFLADPGISEALAVLMENLSSCDPEVLSEVPYSDSYPNDMINQDVVIAKEHDVIYVTDDEETLILEEESRSKMFDKQNDPISIEKKIKISPIDYSKLNKIKEDFVTKKRNGHKESLKDRIKSLSRKDSLEKVKIDIDEIETINIELDHILLNFRYNAQLQEKVFANAALKKELRKLKGKNVVDTTVSKPNATIASGMFKLDIEPISQRLQFNRDAHEIYIDKTIENTDTLCGFVKRARTQNPSEPLLESACINISKQIDSLKTKDSNKSLLTSIGVKPTTSASGSKPSGNTKNNRIMLPPSSNQKTKVEDHSRKVKSSLNKMNFVSEPISNALVKHSVRNAKFESICAICNKCLVDANHDMCIIDNVNDVNVRSKSKSNRNKMRKVWKHTGKVFSEIGYSWKRRGRNFTIVGNMCPLTRSTSNKIVPPKETTIAPVVTPTSGILVYSRRSKATRSIGSSSKVVQIVLYYLDYGCSKHLTGNRSQLINFVSKFLGASKTKSWVCGIEEFSHLKLLYQFLLAKQGLVWVFQNLMYQKGSLVLLPVLLKSKKTLHKPKAETHSEKTLSD
ncbi:retrovirus-related pol polyprotein from transposon TNT 1-94 [Tanacetum coccineum]